MTHKSTGLDDRLYEYLVSVSRREPEILRQLRQETSTLPLGGMQISPEQGQFMGLLARLTGAVKVLEVGVFTGYSSTAMALALPDHGRITALDISPEWTAVARRYWELAGVAGKIDLRLGPGLDSLDALLEEAEANYDFAFIDADKENYDGYYERALRLLKPGGLLLIDNVLWGGRVADESVVDADTVAIRALNRKIHADSRVAISLLPVADGLTLALKLGG